MASGRPDENAAQRHYVYPTDLEDRERECRTCDGTGLVEIEANGLIAQATCPDCQRGRVTAERQVCAEDVWDGPYRMTCGRVLINGRCGRHG